MTFKETLEASKLFKKQTVTIIPNHDLNFVINTDRTRSEYHTHALKILLHKEEKVTSSRMTYKQNYTYFHCAVSYHIRQTVVESVCLQLYLPVKTQKHYHKDLEMFTVTKS